MLRRTLAWQVKRPLFVSGGIAIAVTTIALKASLAVTLGCVVPLIVLLYWKRLRLCAVIALCFLLVAVGYRHTYVLPAEKMDGQIDTVTGTIVAEPSHGRMYTLRVTASSHLPKGSRVMLYFPDGELPALQDTVRARVELHKAYDNQTYYTARGAFVCAFPTQEDGSIRITHHAVPEGVSTRCRTALTSRVRVVLPTRESAILSAMCFGQREHLSPSDEAAFRGSGLSHLLVVSGLHLSMVALAIRRFFRRSGMVACCLITFCAVWLFALLVGLTPSVIRAAVMISLWLAGCLLFCRSDGLNALGLAAMLLLVCHPYTLFDVGFQLSFAATAGVLTLAHRLTPHAPSSHEEIPWQKRLWRTTKKTLKNGAVVCISALLFSLPVACYHYGGFPLTSLPSNLLAAPIAGATMLFGWLGALCGLLPFMSWLSNGLLLIAGLLARCLTGIAHLLSSDWGWITVSQRWQWLLLCGVCAVTVGAILCRIPWRQVAAGLTALILLTAGVGIPFVTQPIHLTVVPMDNESGFLLQQGGHCALIVTDAAKIETVTYETSAFQPDVVFVLGGDTSAVTQFALWPNATVMVATPAEWTVGADQAVCPCPIGGSAALWQGCRLTRLSAGWTLLQAGDQTVCISTDPDEPCPHPDGWHIYVGGAPTVPPDTPYTVVCSDAWLRRRHSALTGRETLLCDETVTFTPLRGEWRALPWL